MHVFSLVSGQGGTNVTTMRADDSVVKTGTHGSTANCLDLSRVNLAAYYGNTSGGSNGLKDFAGCHIAEVVIEIARLSHRIFRP